jgi:hypothetical protein
VDAIIIKVMNKLNIWLRWAFWVFGLGLMISLSTAAMVKAAIAGWIVLSPAMLWGVMVGLVYSWLCPAAGLVLAVRGLMVRAKE